MTSISDSGADLVAKRPFPRPFVVARRMQNLSAGLAVIRFTVTIMVMAMSTSCVLAPPIEAEREQPDQPPFLDFMDPEDPFVTADSPERITLSVRAFDPNPHPNLFYAWVGEETFPVERTANREPGDVLEEGEIFYRFETIERDIDPCGPDLEGEDRETIWVYVSDRPLQLQGRNVVTEPDGFLTSHAWIIQKEPGACF